MGREGMMRSRCFKWEERRGLDDLDGLHCRGSLYGEGAENINTHRPTTVKKMNF